MIGAWTINVSGRLYGPFTSERMRSLASENRLAPHSLVAREGSTDWHEARDEPEFSDLFASRAAQPTNGTQAPPKATPTPAPSSPSEISEGTRAHFAVVVDQKSHSSGNLEEALASLGPYYRLLSNVWIISTDQTVNAVRNRLVQDRTALARWMSRLKRAFHVVEKLQQRVARLDRQLASLEDL